MSQKNPKCNENECSEFGSLEPQARVAFGIAAFTTLGVFALCIGIMTLRKYLLYRQSKKDRIAPPRNSTISRNQDLLTIPRRSNSNEGTELLKQNLSDDEEEGDL